MRKELDANSFNAKFSSKKDDNMSSKGQYICRAMIAYKHMMEL